MALGNAVPEWIVTERVAEIGAAGRNLGAAQVGREMTARREQTALRAVELSGDDAGDRGKPADIRPFGKGCKQSRGVGVMGIGEEALYRLLLDILAGILDRHALGGFGDDSHGMSDEDEAHAGLALELDE